MFPAPWALYHFWLSNRLGLALAQPLASSLMCRCKFFLAFAYQALKFCRLLEILPVPPCVFQPFDVQHSFNVLEFRAIFLVNLFHCQIGSALAYFVGRFFRSFFSNSLKKCFLWVCGILQRRRGLRTSLRECRRLCLLSLAFRGRPAFGTEGSTLWQLRAARRAGLKLLTLRSG